MRIIRFPSIQLRFVHEEDAQFILGLRLNPELNRFLSPVEDDLEAQKEWICHYKERERQNKELYFIIESHEGKRYGTVRLYNIVGNSCTWGSWILVPGRPANAAIESMIAIYDVAFYRLYMELVRFDVRKANTKGVAIHEWFGLQRIHEDDLNVYFELTKADYEILRRKYTPLVTVEIED